MAFLLLALGLTAALQFSDSTSTKSGKCPKYTAMKNFALEPFAGVWYPIVTSADPRFAYCMPLKMTMTSPSTMNVTNFVLLSGPTNIAVKSVFEAYSPDPENSGSMLWVTRYPVVSPVEEVTVVDTDYENYAAYISCSNFGLFHVRQGMIMSRTTNLTTTYIERAQRVLGLNLKLDKAENFVYFRPCAYDKVTTSSTLDVNQAMDKLNDFVSIFTGLLPQK